MEFEFNSLTNEETTLQRLDVKERVALMANILHMR